MSAKKHKNPYFLEETEDQSLWILNPRIRYLIIGILLLAIIALGGQRIKEIQSEGNKRFSSHHEDKGR